MKPNQETAQQPMIPLRAMADEVRTSIDLIEAQRRALVERIGILRAMADDKTAEAESYKAGAMSDAIQRHVATIEAEAQRISVQANLLQQRVQMLLAQLYGAVPMESVSQGARAQARQPWQREAFWKDVQTAVSGLELLGARAEATAAEIGPVCLQDARAAVAAGRSVLSLRPADPAQTPMAAPELLRVLVPKIEAMPWAVLDIDAQNGAQLGQLLEHLTSGLPALPPSDVREEARAAFGALMTAMEGHPELGRVESAHQHFEEENLPFAISVLGGISPPSPLRYEMNALCKRLARLAS